MGTFFSTLQNTFLQPVLHCLHPSRSHRASALLTKERLSKALIESGFLSSISASSAVADQFQVADVNILEIAQCGDGKASTTDRVQLEVVLKSHAGARDEKTKKQRMLLKFCLLPQIFRMGAAPALIRFCGVIASARLSQLLKLDRLIFRGINFYHWYFPHAPDAMYENETRVYKELLSGQLRRAQTDAVFHAPRCFGTIFEYPTSTFGILMEDLSLLNSEETKIRFPNAVEDDLSVEELKAILSNLANLHARFWNDPRLTGEHDVTKPDGNELDWVPDPTSSKGIEFVFQNVGYGLIRDHVLSHEFAVNALKPLGRSIEELWQALEICNRTVISGKKTVSNGSERASFCDAITLCHGDTHVQNVYMVESRTGGLKYCGLYDFQLSLRASWSRDVSYILGTALSPEKRRAHERDLIAFYLQCIRENIQSRISDVNDETATKALLETVPSLDAAMETYSVGMCWGLVIGWLICPPQNYGEKIWLGNVSRLVAACKDLGTFERLLS